MDLPTKQLDCIAVMVWTSAYILRLDDLRYWRDGTWGGHLRPDSYILLRTGLLIYIIFVADTYLLDCLLLSQLYNRDLLIVVIINIPENCSS